LILFYTFIDHILTISTCFDQVFDNNTILLSWSRKKIAIKKNKVLQNLIQFQILMKIKVL